MIVVPAILESFRSLKDKSIKLTFETNEITPDQMQEIALNTQKFGHLVFSGTQLSQDQMDEIERSKNDLYDSTKTPSKRLRNALYVWWSQNPQGYAKFDDYYLFQMERIITNVKTKLE